MLLASLLMNPSMFVLEAGVSRAVIEVVLDTEILAATQLLSPSDFMNNGVTAATVGFVCSGAYVDTGY